MNTLHTYEIHEYIPKVYYFWYTSLDRNKRAPIEQSKIDF